MFYHQEAGIDPRHHSSTSVGAPNEPFKSLSTHDISIDHVDGVPPPEDASNNQTIYPLMRNLASTPDSAKTKAQRKEVGVDDAGGKGISKATGLYMMHQ